MATDRSAPSPSPANAVACHARALTRLTRPRADLPAACAWIEPLADVDLRLSSEPQWGQCLSALTAGARVDHEPTPDTKGPRPPLPRRAADPKTRRGRDPRRTGPSSPPARQAPSHGPELPPRLARPISKAQLAAWARMSTPAGAMRGPVVRPRKANGTPDVIPADHVHAWFHGLGARVIAALTARQSPTGLHGPGQGRPGSAPWADSVNGPTAPESLLLAASRPLVGSAEDQRSNRASGGPESAGPTPHSAWPSVDRAQASHPRRLDVPAQPNATGPAYRSAEGVPQEHAPSVAEGERPATVPPHVRDDAPAPLHDPRSPRSPWPGLATPAPALLPLTVEVGGAELDALAEKIRRILDEEARRHGIEV